MREDGVEAECPCCAHILPPSRTSLSYNKIGPEGARALAETLRTNTALTELECVESVWVYVCVIMCLFI